MMTLESQKALPVRLAAVGKVLVEELFLLQLPGAASEFQGNASGGKAADCFARR